MKVCLKWALVFVFVTCFTKSLFCHPPKNMLLTFDNESKMLKTVVDHNVKDAKKHFIDKVAVFINKVLFIEQSFKQQSDNVSQ